MNAANTCKMMETIIIPFLNRTKFKSKRVLMDNATTHTSSEVINFMNDNRIKYIPFGGKRRGILTGFLLGHLILIQSRWCSLIGLIRCPREWKPTLSLLFQQYLKNGKKFHKVLFVDALEK